MSNLEIIELQNAIISNMAQINAELHSTDSSNMRPWLRTKKPSNWRKRPAT